MSRGARLVPALGLAAALLASLAAPATLAAAAPAAAPAPALAASAPAAADGRATISGGELTWGVRTSIRNYLENFGHTEGYVAAYDGASYRKGDAGARFPAAAGWVDAENDEASISFAGRLHMHGFGSPWLHFEDLRLDISGGVASLTVDMRESFTTPTRVDDVVLATFPLAGSDPVRVEGERVVIQGEEGTFPETIGANHLPRMDGQPTYGGENAYTDPFALTLELAAEPGTTPEPGVDPGTDPGTDPAPDPDPTPVAPGASKAAAHGTSTARNAAGAELTVSPAYSLADTGQTVRLEGTGFPTTGSDGTNFGGLYVLFGWVDPAAGANWGPGSGGTSGRTFTYTQDIEPQGTYQSMVSYPGNTTVPGFPTLSADGAFEMELPILGSRFESQQGIDVDCYEMQCGVMLIGAHGKTNALGEVFVPVYFTDSAEETGGAAPQLPVAAPVSANPNAAVPAAGTVGTAQPSGLAVNGGLAAGGAGDPARTALLGGVLLLSVGALGAALIFRHGRRGGPGRTNSQIGTTA
ncbi:HtaA domain-containing protein [Leucobacter luti]|uniref:Htaa protein n=1 Tax=Leucobacter luti TaxID=340320 RepID=A0A4Q7TY36_9MICO|nr:HtaA domain-containing protein [Leucobacter luti]MBL3698283.1 hypothetical protein [Leucobacter luti]RZT64632.1 Htaa protein [Leucobacter luti]